MSRRGRTNDRPGHWGLPSTLAGSNHLGKQLDRKRREAARRAKAASGDNAEPADADKAAGTAT